MAISTLQNNTNINTAYETTDNSSVKNSSPITNTGFGEVLFQSSSPAVSQNAPTNWLTTPSISDGHRPNVKQFMDATGLNANDASELIYGVIGSNTDTRDWQAILRSNDPINAARSATNAMYNQTVTVPSIPPGDTHHIQPARTIAKAGNFAITETKDINSKVVATQLTLVSSSGKILRDAGNTSQSIQRNAWLFGFDTQPLSSLISAAPMQLQSSMKQVNASAAYQPESMNLNDSIDSFISSTGINSANLLKQLTIA